jgi:hypothetical protein
MIIQLSPQRRDDVLTVIKTGDLLNINGEDFDFSVIPDGATLPSVAVSSPWIVGDVHRVNGELTLTLLLPHLADASHAALFPVDIVDPVDGTLELPV